MAGGSGTANSLAVATEFLYLGAVVSAFPAALPQRIHAVCYNQNLQRTFCFSLRKCLID